MKIDNQPMPEPGRTSLAQPKSPPAKPAEADSAGISPLSHALSAESAADANAERLDQLKRLYADGLYHVPADKIAAKLIEEHELPSSGDTPPDTVT